MSITRNNTLPDQWDATITYAEGDYVSYLGIIYRCVQTSLNNNPALDNDYTYWMPLDIYMKTFTVMPHGEYSGDENFWDRDNIYIDVNGYVYLNGENTGINVKGQDGKTEISFDELTPEQIEQIRGPQGQIGPQGPQGATGPQGPTGYVDLTEEQVALLKGDEGKSTYEIWLEQGHTGTEEDFLAWLRAGVITLDTQLDTTSTNGVENRAIALAFNVYRNQVDALVRGFENRIADLENRLKYQYSGQDYEFKYGITSEGQQGYFEHGTSRIIPFNDTDEVNLTTNLTPNILTSFRQQMTIDDINEEPNEDMNRIIIFKDGQFNPDIDIDFNVYDEFFTYITNNGEICMYSGYKESTREPGDNGRCGFWMSSSIFDSNPGTLTVKIRNINAYKVYAGTWDDSRAKLPDLYSTGEYRLRQDEISLWNYSPSAGKYVFSDSFDYQLQGNENIYITFGDSRNMTMYITEISFR